MSLSTFGPDVDNSLRHFRETIVRANKKQNLVSRRDVNNSLDRLINESLIPLGWNTCRIASPLLDIGSGAGLPGIPLKIAKPELVITLLDSNRHKTLFMRAACEELGLLDTEVVWTRAEVYAEEAGNQGRFGTITARGVGALEQLIGWSIRLLRPGGELIVWSGARIGDIAGLDDFEEPEEKVVAEGLALIRLEKRKG